MNKVTVTCTLALALAFLALVPQAHAIDSAYVNNIVFFTDNGDDTQQVTTYAVANLSYPVGYYYSPEIYVALYDDNMNFLGANWGSGSNFAGAFVSLQSTPLQMYHSFADTYSEVLIEGYPCDEFFYFDIYNLDSYNVWAWYYYDFELLEVPQCIPTEPILLAEILADGQAPPQIHGPHEVWYFGGYEDGGYNVSPYETWLVLTCTGGASSYTWTVTTGSDKLVIIDQLNNSIRLRGKDLSAQSGDISVTVTADSVSSSPYSETVRGPWNLVATPTSPSDVADSTYGYISTIKYYIKDNLGYYLQHDIPVNESWGSPFYDDTPNQNCNWIPGPTTGALTTNLILADNLSGGHSGPPDPVPTPLAPGNLCEAGICKVQHWVQEWKAGSTTSGAGLYLQIDTLQKYLDHARHIIWQ